MVSLSMQYLSALCVLSVYILLMGVSLLQYLSALCTLYTSMGVSLLYACTLSSMLCNSLYNYSVLSAVSALPCLCSVLPSIQRAPTCARPPCRRVGDEPQLCPVQYLLHSLLCFTATTDGGAPPC